MKRKRQYSHALIAVLLVIGDSRLRGTRSACATLWSNIQVPPWFCRGWRVATLAPWTTDCTAPPRWGTRCTARRASGFASWTVCPRAGWARCGAASPAPCSGTWCAGALVGWRPPSTSPTRAVNAPTPPFSATLASLSTTHSSENRYFFHLNFSSLSNHIFFLSQLFMDMNCTIVNYHDFKLIIPETNRTDHIDLLITLLDLCFWETLLFIILHIL